MTNDIEALAKRVEAEPWDLALKLKRCDTLEELARIVESLTEPIRAVDLHIMRHAMNIGGDPANAERYTGSLDAAITLVPDGYRVLMDTDPHRGPPARCLVRNSGDSGTSADGTLAATPALALTAAALRARAAEGEG